MTKLYVLAEYHNGPRQAHYRPGEEIEVDPLAADFLLRDAPGCFATEKPKVEAKATKAPPKDKAVKTAANKAESHEGPAEGQSGEGLSKE